MITLVVLAGLGAMLGPMPAWADEHDTGLGARAEPFKRLPDIVFDDCDPACGEGNRNFLSNGTVRSTFVDVGRRRLYAVGQETAVSPRRNWIAVVDLDRLEQVAYIELGFTVQTPRAMAYDPGRHRLYFGQAWDFLECSITGPDLPCRTEPRWLWTVDLYDDDESRATIRSRRLPSALGGENVHSIGLDLKRGLVYVVTGPFGLSQITGVLISVGGAVQQPALTVFEAPPREAALGPPRGLTRIQPCLEAVGGSSFSQRIVVGHDGDYVAIPCIGAKPLGYGEVVAGGIARVALPLPEMIANPASSEEPAPAQVQAANIEFFRFPGNLPGAEAFADPVGEKLFMVPIQTGRVLGVFDARQRAWAGRAELHSRPGPGGVDPMTGRAYVTCNSSCPDAFFWFADTAAVPVEADPTTYTIHTRGNPPVVDPVTRRLFFGRDRSLQVVEDRTPPYIPPPPDDPDEATHDIDEQLASSVTRIANSRAYGGRVLLVGGAERSLQFGEGDQEVSVRRAIREIDPRLYPTEGERGLFLGRIARANLAAGGEAEASATGVEVDTATENDLRLWHREIVGPFMEGAGGAENEDCNLESPGAACFGYDALRANVGVLQESACQDFGNPDDVTSAEARGSAVSCRQNEGAAGWASSSPAMTASPARIGYTESSATVVRDPERGAVTTVEAVARDVEIDVPGAGAIRIGEVRSKAETWAMGRPQTASGARGAGSNFETAVNQARIVDAAGRTVFACGFEGGTDDEVGRCDPRALVDEINKRFALQVEARVAQRDLDERVTGSPGGARAMVRKHDVAFYSDRALHGEERREVSALELIVYLDDTQPRRLVLQLAAVYGESQYVIGPPAPEAEPLGPASLVVELVDDAGETLAGGMFEVRAAGDLPEAPEPFDDLDPDDTDPHDSEAGDGGDANGDANDQADGSEANGNGNDNESFQSQSADVGDSPDSVPGLDDELVDGAVCVTADDGIGTCVFEDLEPGTYQVMQTAAPDGYFPAEPYVVDAFPGFDTLVTFTNLRAVGGVEINLTDDSDTPEPLEGGEFALLAAGSEEVGRCVTGPEGTCGFADVALGDYVVRQEAAPGEYLPVDDIPFALAQPGQVAVLSIVNGLGGIEAAAPPAAAPPLVEPVTFRPGPTPPQPVVHRTPSASPPPPRTGLDRVLALPGDVLAFLARRPLEALLMIGVWLLLAAPAYLAARRRSLVIAKGVM